MNLAIGLLQRPLAQQLAWALLHFLWQGAAVSIVFAVGMRLLRDHSANARYIFGCVSLFAMPAVVALTFALESNGPPSSGLITTVEKQAPLDSNRMAASTTEERARQSEVTASRTEGRVTLRMSNVVRPFLPLIVGIWLAGVSFLSLRLISGWTHVQFLRFRQTESINELLATTMALLKRKLAI